jgi:hypothetical protein
MLGVGTGTLASSVYMFVLGVGIGAVMQVLVIAVQNVVPYSDLGAATSGATFFRSIGGSFGTAVFGAIFASQLTSNVPRYLAGVHLPAGFSPTAGASPAVLATLPPAVHSGFIQAYAASLHTVFLVAVPISAAAFALSWLLQEVPLRRTSTAPNPADTLAPTSMPSQSTSLDEIGRALSVLAGGEGRQRIYHRLAARAGLDLDPPTVWMLFRIYDHPDEDLDARARRLHRPAEVILPLLDGLAERGLAAPLDGASGPGAPPDGTVHLTSQGQAAVASLVTARQTALAELIEDWNPEQHAELAQLLTRLARSLAEEPAPAR